MIRHSIALLFIMLSAAVMQAQTGPCTDRAIKLGSLPTADRAFSYMPPYGKPVVGKTQIETANAKDFADRTNIKWEWVSDRRIVSAPSGEMAYEHGTVHVSYENRKDGSPHEFKAVILSVYMAKGDVCQRVAETMQPLGEHDDR